MENRIQAVNQAAIDAAESMGLNKLKAELADLDEQSQSSDFWQDNTHAQAVMQQIVNLKRRIEPWDELLNLTGELIELNALGDSGLQEEIETSLIEAETKLSKLKRELILSGPYDDHGAILSIFAGAGGTDAQDWAQMLLRMYIRFMDKNGWNYRMVDESPGEEAGIKTASLEVNSGDGFIYGKLKGEHGVHRLVRLSPFNADHLRQTSFAKVEVIPKIDSSAEIEIDDKELKIDVYRSSGHGGQSVNTTDSAVRVTHLPTGITVAIQNERSQLQNRETALTILRSKLAQLKLEQHAKRLSDLKGPNQAAEWGNQIRNYVLHPYKQVKDLRTHYQTRDVAAVLDGNIGPIIDAYLEHVSRLK
jgi:peptide chain release factor 2